MASNFRSLFGATLILLGAANLLPAQDARGRIVGRVLDPSKAVIAGADVTATQMAMNVHVTTKTNASGNYDLQYLLPGIYRIDVTAPGFKQYTRRPIEVRVGDTVTLNITLSMGQVSEKVDVVAEASLLDASTASMAQVVEHKQLQDLPASGGDVMFLMQLSSGVSTAQTPGHNWLPSANDVMSNVNMVGTANGSNEFTLDGISNMTRGWVSFTPPADMVQEFRVQTVTYDASLGHAAGGTINMSLKTGTNQLHGTAQWDVAPNPWQANSFFTNKQIYDTSTGPVTPEKIHALSPPRKTNRYSATLGGPLYIPHVYDGHSKTFWTYGFQGFNRRSPGSNYYTVPTAAEQNGDFSALLGIPKTGSSYQLYDPATIAPAGNGRFSRQPLPGNIIPASRISPLAQNYLKYFAQPNVPGTVDGRNNYQITQPDANDSPQNTERLPPEHGARRPQHQRPQPPVRSLHPVLAALCARQRLQ
ncbi:MAG: carboxypeptidase regulatory-like domain-containing protein [Acidobacteria bacterium]|nr:carboxypeptidase regulatory-like domain-containing protein [Acidobacteriota bacterium]